VLNGKTDAAFLLYAILVISLSGAITDLVCGKIFNWLTLPAVVLGLAASFWLGGFEGLSSAMLATVAGLFLYGWMFIFGAMGAGDVKFLMALGAWGGLKFVVQTALLGIAVGGVLALAMLIFKGRFKSFIQRMHHFFLTALLEELTIEKPKIDYSLSMPFGIPIAIAAVWVAFGHPWEMLGVSL
jgi:prepilin peptidase CpaA